MMSNSNQIHVTTYRSNSPTAFFDLPQDATPQDCITIVARLIVQADAILKSLNFNDPIIGNFQKDVVLNLLMQAYYANDLIDYNQIANTKEIKL